MLNTFNSSTAVQHQTIIIISIYHFLILGEQDHTPTPPKQRRITLQSQSSLTPSTLLSRLDLSTDKEGKLFPKQLFEFHSSESEDNLASELLCGSNKYQDARKALHSSITEDLPGREEELAKLHEFLHNHLEKETSASLYVSGPPGTGKTASLFKIMQQPQLRSKLRVVYINCTTIKSAAAIYAKIIQELSITSSTKSGRNNKAIIENYLTSRHKMLMLVLDEIDQLESRKQSVLYSIFEWPSIASAKLILVGIANSLDLTDRILPRLQARCEFKPTLMHFASYTKQQISNIILARLNQANATNVFTPSAIQLLAGKVAAISGDIRRALDISRRVVELAESHQTAQVLRPTNDNDTNTESLQKEPEIAQKPVDLKEVVTVLSGVYLYEVYKKVCKKRNIHAVDISEFVSLCSLIETRGILRVVGKKEARLSKVNLQWDLEEWTRSCRTKK
ncbi:Cell division control protein 6-like protein [Ooceraea biroi]|uniref:Cell division control protein n=1 Tax=Ooceraea biroi TaxID=2015173 RepID=A0A026W0E2_OOCBI|nr:Cell division control protein 6-like protein [Ooceraea biroi]